MLKVIEIFRTRDELDKLVNLPNSRYKSGIRNRAILSVLCYAGLRVSELLNLKVSDVKESESHIRVNETKRKSSRVIYVPNYLFHYINKWLEIRPKSKYFMKTKPSNKNLHKASQAKKDEFYTQLTDIESELKHCKEQFRGKVVFCNCDDPKESNFVKYFSMNFEHWGLKKLVATHYKDANLFTQEPPYKLEYTGDKNGNRMPDPDEFITEMIGTGDFRSEECIKLLKEADIVVTNPPFSLFREYIAQLMEYNKKFLIIGNINAITYKECFKCIKDNKMWLGASIHSGDREFRVPDDYPLNAAGYRVDKDGNKYIRVKGVRWLTNLDYEERYENLVLYKKYSPEEYPKYDNYDAINVDKTNEIPADYKGVMGVPITFLDKYNPEQFKIIGIDRYVEDNPNYGKRFTINGREIYARIIIKNKKVKK